MVRLPDSERDKTRSNGAVVNQEKVNAAIDDWKTHQLHVEARTLRWRRVQIALEVAALALGVGILVVLLSIATAIRANTRIVGAAHGVAVPEGD